MIPTAEEIALQIEEKASYDELVNPIIFASLVAKEFAKLHVKQALKEASEKVIKDNMVDNCDDHTPYWGPCQSCGKIYNFKRLTKDTNTIQESILNAYPLNNIK